MIGWEGSKWENTLEGERAWPRRLLLRSWLKRYGQGCDMKRSDGVMLSQVLVGILGFAELFLSRFSADEVAGVSF